VDNEGYVHQVLQSTLLESILSPSSDLRERVLAGALSAASSALPSPGHRSRQRPLATPPRRRRCVPSDRRQASFSESPPEASPS
jgi:hypothetical protein